MEIKQPTQEQIREFWEWCGWSQVRTTINNLAWLAPDGAYPDVYGVEAPPIDLNYLFRYAVPKLDTVRNIRHIIFSVASSEAPPTSWTCEIVWFLYRTKEKPTFGKGSSPALALFWAIWEVIKGGPSNGQ